MKIDNLKKDEVIDKEYSRLLNKKYKLRKHWIIQREKPFIKENPFVLT